jgi:hypothetical protein
MQPKASRNLDILELTLYQLDTPTFSEEVPLSTDRDFIRPLLKTYLSFPSKPELEFSQSEDTPNREFELLSYSGRDVELKRQILPFRGERVAGFLLHEFDTVPGTSGSPILMGNKVVGIHVGTLKSHKINIAVPIETYIADQRHKEECEAAVFSNETSGDKEDLCEPLFEIAIFLYDEECNPQTHSCKDPEPQSPRGGYDPDFPSDSSDPGHNDRARGSGDRGRDRFNDWMRDRQSRGQDPKSDPRWKNYAAKIGTVLVDIAIDAAITVAVERYMPGTGRMVKSVGASGMNRLLKSAGPTIRRFVERFDKGNLNTKTQDHVHFKDGTSYNRDGTIHDKQNGIPSPPAKVTDFLRQNGWSVPD